MPIPPAFAQLDEQNPALALDDTYYVLENRHKFVELRGQLEINGVLSNPDGIVWEISDEVDHGDLYLVSGATYLYVPTEDYEGTDSFEFRSLGSYINEATVTLVVDDAFHPPHGLDPPAFGITEDADDYSRGTSLEYYVDPDHGSSTDTSNPNGTTSIPRKTIPLSLPAGALVEVHGYGDAAASQIITASGTSTAPIFIRGAGPLDRGTLRRGVHIQGNYVIFEYIDFDAASEPYSPPNLYWFRVMEQSQKTGSSHVAVRHCAFFGHLTGEPDGVTAMVFGVSRGSSPPSPNNGTTKVTDCVVYDTMVADFGDYTAGTGNDYYGAAGEANSENTWILDSVFHHLQGGGAVLSRANALSNQLAARRGFIGRNVIHHAREFGISIKLAKDSIVTQNKVSRVRKAPTTNTGGGIFIGHNDHCNPNENATTDYYSDNVWAIFNHVYDVQTGVNIVQNVHCDGGTGCCPNSLPDDGGAQEDELCCPEEAECYAGPTYEPARMYVVGNVFNHIEPYLAEPETSYGQAVLVGRQAQVRVVNNTMFKCAQGVQIPGTHNTGECPPGGDGDNGEQGIRRNTSVAVWNNAILDAPDDGTNDAHVRVTTNRYSGQQSWPYTLTNEDFDRNFHYGNMDVRLPSGNYSTVATLRSDAWTNYGAASHDEDAPELEDVDLLLFDLTGESPDYMSTNGIKDSAYTDFTTAFSTFPHIFRDYEGNTYSGNICAMGAFKGD